MQGVSNHGGIGVNVFKDKRRGWKADSVIRLDDIMPGKNRRLSIRTSKNCRGVVNSWASVATHKDGFMTFLVFQDFSRTVLIEPFSMKCGGMHAIRRDPATGVLSGAADSRRDGAAMTV